MSRVAMVSAGLSGLGLAISRDLSDHRYRVSAATSSGRAAEAESMQAFAWAPSEAGAGRAWVAHVMKEWERVDVLVNNLGPYLWDYPRVADTDQAAWKHMLDTNLTVAFELIQAVIPIMRQQGGGAIINLGFLGAGMSRGWPLRGAYAAAKAGLASLTRTVALEEQHHGISSVMVCPSDIRGPYKEMTKGLVEGNQAVLSGYDVARVVSFLAEPASRALSGNVIELAAPWVREARGIGDRVWVAELNRAGVVEEVQAAGAPLMYRVQIFGAGSAWYPPEALTEPTDS
jgi:3-oxoacyl-[acyl-carrier protein] reductase